MGYPKTSIHLLNFGVLFVPEKINFEHNKLYQYYYLLKSMLYEIFSVFFYDNEEVDNKILIKILCAEKIDIKKRISKT